MRRAPNPLPVQPACDAIIADGKQAGMDQGKNMVLSCFLAVSGGTIVPPQWPDRPASGTIR